MRDYITQSALRGVMGSLANRCTTQPRLSACLTRTKPSRSSPTPRQKRSDDNQPVSAPAGITRANGHVT